MRDHGLDRGHVDRMGAERLDDLARPPGLLAALLLAGALATAPAFAEEPAGPALDRIVASATDALARMRDPDGVFSRPAYLGPHYCSQHLLVARWLGRPLAPERTGLLCALLEREQQADGSWEAAHDGRHPDGDLDASVLNYWALKACGRSPASAPMLRARGFILGKGGLAATSALVKMQLALFGQYPWSRLPLVPFLLFQEGSPVTSGSFAQWIGPHIMPLAYLRHFRVVRNVGPELDLAELEARPRPPPTFIGGLLDRPFPSPSGRIKRYVARLLGLQQPRGTWGGYAVATLLSVAVLTHRLEVLGASPPAPAGAPGKLQLAIERGLAEVERLYWDSGASRLRGVPFDGRCWDTALAVWTLGECGIAPGEQADSRKRLEELANPTSGGFGFGPDFVAAPDTDTTAITMLALRQAGGGPSVSRARDWVLSMQNRDGGWGAFDRDNTGNAALRAVAGKFLDSTDLFDESTEDVTGHVLEALAGTGLDRTSSPAVRRAIEYLWRRQDPRFGSWPGRWGVNHIYGTAAAVSGLVRAGVPASEARITRAVDWLASCQNRDGGFGESPRSYRSPEDRGRGESTPSQSAWALMALVDGGRARSAAATRVVVHLREEFARSGVWTDRSTVGTGHPGICSMDYPIYPATFPLLALVRYRAALAGSRSGR